MFTPREVHVPRQLSPTVLYRLLYAAYHGNCVASAMMGEMDRQTFQDSFSNAGDGLTHMPVITKDEAIAAARKAALQRGPGLDTEIIFWVNGQTCEVICPKDLAPLPFLARLAKCLNYWFLDQRRQSK